MLLSEALCELQRATEALENASKMLHCTCEEVKGRFPHELNRLLGTLAAAELEERKHFRTFGYTPNTPEALSDWRGVYQKKQQAINSIVEYSLTLRS